MPNLQITQPCRHQPREFPVFPNASCLGTLCHDSQRPRGVIYRLAVTSHDSRSTAMPIAGLTVCGFSSTGPISRLKTSAVRRVERLRKRTSLKNHVPYRIPTPAATCGMVHAVNRQSKNRVSHAIRISCSWPNVAAERGCVGTRTPVQLPVRRPRGSVEFDLHPPHFFLR